MRSKSPYLITIIFLISSCGNETTTSSNVGENNTSTSFEETCTSYGKNTQRCNFIHDGLDRYYLIYRPTFIANNNVPILFALHGYGSSAAFHKSYTQYEQIADQNNFIVIYPQGYKFESLLANSSSHWNVGAWTVASDIDDVDFIDTIIDLVSSKEQINQNRIYSSGMSNGGFMSYHLACNLSSRIAAIASVTGSMSRETLASCSPNHPTSVLQIHGLEDAVVPYAGIEALGMEPIDDVLTFWADANNCNPVRVIAVVDSFSNNNSADYINYESCENDVDVKLIRIPSMGHTWPDLNNFNISATEEIWSFLSQYDLNGKIAN